jgi:hypothetical protein
VLFSFFFGIVKHLVKEKSVLRMTLEKGFPKPGCLCVHDAHNLVLVVLPDTNDFFPEAALFLNVSLKHTWVIPRPVPPLKTPVVGFRRSHVGLYKKVANPQKILLWSVLAKLCLHLCPSLKSS